MVVAKTLELAEQVCETAVDAKAFLARCSLIQKRPITIEVKARVEGPAEHCAGLYYKGQDRVAVIGPSQVADVIPSDSAFAGLDPNIYHRSLVIHELAHALMDQSGFSEPICSADHEYVAYAMQISSLPAESQKAVTSYHSVERPVDPDWVNDFTLSFRPDLFAVYAWSHFEEAGNGCGFVKKLLDGETTFKVHEF